MTKLYVKHEFLRVFNLDVFPEEVSFENYVAEVDDERASVACLKRPDMFRLEPWDVQIPADNIPTFDESDSDPEEETD